VAATRFPKMERRFNPCVDKDLSVTKEDVELFAILESSARDFFSRLGGMIRALMMQALLLLVTTLRPRLVVGATAS
jgi:hypothetical protein